MKPSRTETVRNAFNFFGRSMAEKLPMCPETGLVMQKLQEASMWAQIAAGQAEESPIVTPDTRIVKP